MAEEARLGRASDWLSDRALRGIIGGALSLPYATRVRTMGRIMRRVIGPVAGYRRRARTNLAFIYPEMPPGDVRRIADEVLDNFGRTLIENYSTRDLLARMARVNPEGPGLQALEEARDKRRPVVLVTGHFGNYEAVRACLVGKGYEIGGLYRPMANAYFNAHYEKTMTDFGGPVFAQGAKGTAGFVKHLRRGGMLVLLFDQFVYREPELTFFGRPARTATSAAQLALRYDAHLIPFYGTRLPNGLDFRCELEAPVPHSDAETMTQALNNSLERRVRQNPGQWFWVHRRWRGHGAPRCGG